MSQMWYTGAVSGPISTSAPTTAGPTTEAPGTEPGTTAAPTTGAPTTPAPTTPAPTTAAPTTAAPTTAAPQGSGVSAIENLAYNTTLTGAGAGDTMGSWVELIASTSKEYNGILITVARPSPGNVNMLIDLGAGAAAAEAVIVEGIALRSGTTVDPSGYTFYLPLRVESGTRLAARCQSADGGSDTCTITVHGMDNSNQLYESIASYGFDKVNTALTAIDPGGTADTKGPWVELTDETGNDITWLAIQLLINNALPSTCSWALDIGVGGAGSEQVVIADLYAGLHSNYDKGMPGSIGALPIDIPAGSRIAVRAACSITDATDRVIQVGLHGAEN